MSSPTTPDSEGDVGTEQVAAAPAVEKPYHAKRPHKKSRMGCRNCKSRKVKCDETRPSCRACMLRRVFCSYLDAPAPTPDAHSRSSSAGKTTSDHRQGPERRQGPEPATPMIEPWAMPGASDSCDVSLFPLFIEPAFRPAGIDATDMRLLWFYTTHTYGSFIATGISLPRVDEIMKIRIVQHAFTSPFLMSSILGLTAVHLQNLGPDNPLRISPTKALVYKQRAFVGYRSAIQEAKAETYPALLACSLLLCALSSQQFRDPDAKPLFILDWIIVWRGVGTIIRLVTPETLLQSGIAELFFRPRVDLDTAVQHIPNNLLFMIKSIQSHEEDYPYVQDYYDTLKYLGSLYQELARGFSPALILRIIVFFTFPPADFIEMARRRQPRALVIIAHYLVFAKLAGRIWWMQGISDRDIRNISKLLGDEWASLLKVPCAAVGLHDNQAVARLLLDNRTWESPTPDPSHNIPRKSQSPSDMRDVSPDDSYRNDGQFRYVSPVMLAMRAKVQLPVYNDTVMLPPATVPIEESPSPPTSEGSF